jgi:hypothetical protein
MANFKIVIVIASYNLAGTEETKFRRKSLLQKLISDPRVIKKKGTIL